MNTTTFPLRMEAQLDAPSRFLWLVKWILAIPHYVVLVFLWVAFAVLSIVAFFSILFTARYPRSIFDFNVGVLRWSWRVAYYSYAALGTDRYPPFTLDEVPDYPTHLDITYPERLSRGLVLVKWWLLAIPHYVVVGLLAGGTWLAWESGGTRIGFSGLIGVLALIAAVALAFTGRYPQPLFDLILGFNRWVLRVAAYAALMTDTYPPFRLDSGGSESGGTLTVPAPQGVPALPAAPSPAATSGWTGGRIVSTVIGSLLLLVSLPMLAGGVAGTVVDQTQRDFAGYVTMADGSFATSGYALTSEGVDMRFDEGSAWLAERTVGDVRLTVVPQTVSDDLFVGVGRVADVEAYLGGVERARVSGIGFGADYRTLPGDAPSGPPADETFWVATSEGTGRHALEVPFDNGAWELVVMNADGSRGIEAEASVAATVPALGWMSAGAIAFGALVLGAGLAMVLIATRRATS